ncbi:site-specific integrase [Archaeoglobus sulfaticallidus]|uniref:site-specific integrase n=1 Tax=Archaeoglobus sulfaticallidus TaxID=1316941 RepID=UPI000A8AA7A2|nr:site-specific integrase [Archaeoglobus sulfaticallidus]
MIKPIHVRNLIHEIDQKVRYEPLRLRAKAAVLLATTSGLRAMEVYKLMIDDIDVRNRTVFVRAEIAKDYEERITFFNEEAKQALEDYLATNPSSNLFYNLRDAFEKIDSKLRMKHMRKFFSQQSDRLGMPTAIKKILMGHVVGNEEYVALRGVDVDLEHYDFQDEEELKKIYDKYWRDFKILD